LDVVITDREKKSGKQVTRPRIDRDVPFGKSFESFLMTWAFLQSFGCVEQLVSCLVSLLQLIFLICRSSVLKISSFTLDDYENAIRHNIAELPCNLLAEAHACLLAVARERAGTKYMAMGSLEAHEPVETDADPGKRIHSGASLADIAHEAKGLGYKAHMSGVSPSKDFPRAGWEDALAIYIRDV
jgi:bromodomain adjacent to zinc finger domain protein 1A